MNPPDPYVLIEQLCHVSSSQEEFLRRCRFANEPPAPDNPLSHETEDNDVAFGESVANEFPVESEGIVMVSLPETPSEEGIPQNVPPSEAEATSRNSESLEGAVDLGRDTDLVFTSEADWTERIEVREIRVSRGALRVDAESGGKLGNSVSNRGESSSQSKRLKVGVEAPRGREDLGKSVEELDGEIIGQTRVGGVRGEKYSKRPLEFSDRVLGSDKEVVGVSDPDLGFSDRRGCVRDNNNVGVSDSGFGCSDRRAGRKSIDDIDKFRYVGRGDAGSSRKEMGASGKRTLPASIRGWTNGADGAELKCDGDVCAKEWKEVTLLEVLKMLGEGSNNDRSVENLSVLEVAKRRGMTFP